VLLLVSTLLGGIGLFLLGMILMSDGLKGAAGNALQRVLRHSTGTPLRAFASGAGITALVQSSSATTLATIGFVSAGLLTLPAALGVIVGAAVGTTSTGWIVALLGLKLNLGAVALPLIGVGALMRLLGHGPRAHIGMALAGFGLIFVGIEGLRDGMGGLAETLDLGAFTGRTLLGRLQLVGIGLVMTVVLQSSSAAVALTLTAVHSGAIGMEAAAALVIGQNVGTTVTSGLASVGGSVAARRAALGHVVFNGFAGTLAFATLGPLLAGLDAAAEALGADDPAVTVTLFHTAFNVGAALVTLPLLRPLARGVTRLIPERVPTLARRLDRTLLELPAVALGAASDTMGEVARTTFSAVRDGLVGAPPARVAARLAEAQDALRRTHHFLGEVRMGREAETVVARRLSLLHAGDHLDRLIEHVRLDASLVLDSPDLQDAARAVRAALEEGAEVLAAPANGSDASLEEASVRLAETRRRQRETLLVRTAAGEVSPDEASRRLDAMRHLDRVVYHVWRAVHHLTVPPSAQAYQPAGGELAAF
jgi:phosphate:Na+ symporter